MTTAILRLVPSWAAPRPAVIASLAAVYVIWGSTYFAMRVALGGFPPLAMASLRFLIAGGLAYGWLRLRGQPGPSRRQWAASAVVGALLLAVGNGAVVFAQQWLSSGLAAVVVSTMPLWAALFAALEGRRPSRLEGLGLALGLAGVVVLELGGEISSQGPWALVVLLGPAAFALGSVWSRRMPLPAGAMAPAAEMLCAGVLLGAVSLARGERLHEVPAPAALLALAYLVVFGSLVALTAYTFLLRETRPALATSYAYVNPVIAVAIGVAFAGESIGPAAWLAGAVVLTGVALITLAGTRTLPPSRGASGAGAP